MYTNSMVPYTGMNGTRYAGSLLDDDLVSDFFAPEPIYPKVLTQRATAWPAVDVHELKDKYIVRADVPGVDEKDIKIEFVDGALVLEGTRRNEDQGQDFRIHLHERAHCHFRRTFELGSDIQADKIHATYKNGTLSIEIPKAEKAIPRAIPITVTKH